MKKYKLNILFLSLIVFLFSACIENNEITFQDTVVEFDAATFNSKASGQVYPLLTRVPGYGRATRTSVIAATTLSPAAPADPLLNRISGLVKFRVNLVGAQRGTDIVLNYKVLPTSTAISGTHYSTANTVTIPANSSYGEVSVQIVNALITSTTPVLLVLQLEAANGVNVSENFKTIGLSIAQN